MRKKFYYWRQEIWLVVPVLLHFLNNVIANYVTSMGWQIVLLVVLQLVAIPVFTYLLDAGLRDHLRNIPTSEVVEEVVPDEQASLEEDN